MAILYQNEPYNHTSNNDTYILCMEPHGTIGGTMGEISASTQCQICAQKNNVSIPISSTQKHAINQLWNTKTFAAPRFYNKLEKQ
jgi:hypothetical protein